MTKCQFGRHHTAAILAALLPLILWGCAGRTLHREGLDDIAHGRVEQGLAKLQLAMEDSPDNMEYRVHYLNAKDQVANGLLAQAERAKMAGRLDQAEAAYRRVLGLGSENFQADAGLAEIAMARRHATQLAEANTLLAAGEYETAERKIAKVLQENPRNAEARRLIHEIDEKTGRNQVLAPSLRRALQKPITLEFREANLRQVLEALSQHSGLNFIIDRDVPPQTTITVFLKQVSVEDALDVMLGTNQLARRVLNNNTLLIYPDTAAKQSDLQDLVVKNFFLANAEAKNVANMLRTVLKAKNVFADDKLNLLIMRDTPNMIRLAERMIATQDVPEPEVMLDVQIVEVKRTSLLNLGIQFPEQLSLIPLPRNGGTNLTLDDIRNLRSSNTGATISPLIINLAHQVGEGNLLANPRIRTHNREKALIRIGDRVPVITTTATSTGFVTENVQYLDVGLRLEVEPTIYPDDEIGLKLALEVSSITNQRVSAQGSVSYQIGGRNASTVLRLRDGETQVLGGLINNQDIMAAHRFPGLGDLPVLGRLFSSQSDDDQRTELLMIITPHLVRGLTPPATVPAEFWSGTENSPRLKPLAVGNTDEPPPLTAPTPAPAAPAAPAPAPAPSPAQGSSVVPPQPAVPATPIPVAPPPAPAPTPAAAPSAVLHWEGPNQAKVGEPLRLSLRIATDTAIQTFPLRIQYDPTVFDARDPAAGRFMTQGGAIAETRTVIDPVAGTITVNQTRSGPQRGKGAKGEGELLRLELRPKQANPSSAITVQPSAPLGANDQPLTPTTPATTSITIAP